jgi:hypothetical protein
VPSTDQIPARREFKYLAPAGALPALRASIAPYCAMDAHAGPDGTYGLRSLYLDAPDMRLYHANEREASTRFKARVRTYSDTPGSPVFGEIKHRDGDVIRKPRVRLPAHDWTAGVRPGAALNPFLVQVLRHDLRPVVLVEYRREAWMSRIDEYARVSIDTQIRCQTRREWSLDADPDRWRPVDHTLLTFTPSSACVVELKWAGSAPPWMTLVVRRLDALRASFSKYCYSMQALADDHYRDGREAQSVWG